MTVEVILTGTGCPLPAPGRAGPGVLVRTGQLALQFDAGRATVMRLAEAGTASTELAAVFITHHHSDHLTDLTDLAFTRWLRSAEHPERAPVPIVGPAGPLVTILESLLDPWEADLEIRTRHTGRVDRPALDVRTFDATAEASEVWRRDDVVVSSVTVHHEPVEPAVAYRVDTPEASVVISGDTRACEEVEALASGVDLLVHEVGLLASLGQTVAGTSQEAIFNYHTDTRELGALANRSQVKALALTHLIPTPPAGSDLSLFVDEVRAGGYRGEIVAGDDLTTFTIAGR